MRIWLLGLVVACGAPPNTSKIVPPAPPIPINTEKARPTLELTWLVYPYLRDAKDPGRMPVASLALMVGNERIELKPQTGSIKPHHQSTCHRGAGPHTYPLEADEVAKITFSEGGDGGYLVKRAPDGLVLMEWEQTPLACLDEKTNQPKDCPRREFGERVLNAPTNLEIVQRLIQVDAAGTQKPFPCSQS
jgi:hypothetical protein